MNEDLKCPVCGTLVWESEEEGNYKQRVVVNAEIDGLVKRDPAALFCQAHRVFRCARGHEAPFELSLRLEKIVMATAWNVPTQSYQP
jgi:hypothetical protein